MSKSACAGEDKGWGEYGQCESHTGRFRLQIARKNRQKLTTTFIFFARLFAFVKIMIIFAFGVL